MARPSASIALDADRRLAVPIGAVRVELERCLRLEGFTIAGTQATQLEATRGNALGALGHERLPMRAVVRFSPDDAGCRLALHLEERALGATRFLGAHGAYQTAFVSLLATLDAGLTRVDPKVELPAPLINSPQAPVQALEQVGGGVSRAGHKVFNRANRFLEGRGKSVPVAWKGLEVVVLASSKGHAEVDLESIRAMLVVANLVSERPGALPPKLTRELDAFAVRLEGSLEAAGGAERAYLAVTDDELPVVKFLAIQAAIRQQLPLRTLHVCTTCKLEKVTNPDYERLQARNRRLRSLTGGLGATVSKSGVSPFVVVGQLMKIKKLDPDYVCTRCQSLDADTSVVTFCPDCGERRQEPVLRTCPKCNHDFRKGILDDFWHPDPEPVLHAATAGLLPAWQPSPIAGLPAIPVPPALAAAHEAAADHDPAANHDPGLQPPAWHPDPSGRWRLRWWDGTRWSEHVASDDTQGVDPL